MKRLPFLALSLLIVLSMVLAACAPAATATPAAQKPTDKPAVTTPKTGGTLKWMIAGEPTTLLSWTTRNPIDQTVLGVTNEYLMKYDAKGVAQPYLIESIKPDQAALTFTLVIKKGIKFHDGSDLNAEVVAWNLNTYKKSGVLTGSFYTEFENATAQDANTVVIKMNKWNSLFPSALARTAYMTSKAAFDKNGEEYLKSHPVGTGPFMFDKWDHNVSVNLVAFKDYWRGAPRLAGLNLVIYTSSQVATAALKSGELDIYPVTEFALAKSLEGVAGIKVDTAALTGTGYTLSYNCMDESDPLSKLAVRQAISYAIDAKAIAKATTSGYSFDSTQWSLTTDPVYSSKVTGFPYDPAKAKQLLKDAGYENGFKTRITLQTKSLEDGAQIIAQQLAAVGITAELNIVEVANYAGFIGDWEYGMLLHPMGTSNGQASQLAANFVKGLSRGLGIAAFLHTDEVDKMIKDAVAADEATSNKMFQDIAFKVFEEQAMMKVVVLTKSVVAYTDKLKDFGLYKTGIVADELHLAWLDK